MSQEKDYIPSFMTSDDENFDPRDYDKNYDPIKDDEADEAVERIQNGTEEPQSDMEDLVPLLPENLETKRALTFMAENESKVADLMKSLIDQGYTTITPENILEWSEIIGTDKALEAHIKGGANMLPEYYALFNLSSQSRAMMMAQLMTFAELWRGITDSNDVALYQLQKKFQRETEEHTKKITSTIKAEIQESKQEFLNEAKEILNQVKKNKTELNNIIVKSENIQNNIKKAEEETLKVIERQLEKLFTDNLTKASSIAGVQMGRKLKDAQMKDIGLKTHLIYVAGSVLTLLIGLGIGKFLH